MPCAVARRRPLPAGRSEPGAAEGALHGVIIIREIRALPWRTTDGPAAANCRQWRYSPRCSAPISPASAVTALARDPPLHRRGDAHGLSARKAIDSASSDPASTRLELRLVLLGNQWQGRGRDAASRHVTARAGPGRVGPCRGTGAG